MYSKPLFWEHGTFLQPQHFQLADKLRDESLEPLRSLLCPHFWGARRFALREDVLAAGILDVAELDLLLPGGERLRLPDNVFLPARSFREAWINPESPLKVWLGLPVGAFNGGNVVETEMPAEAPASARFVADPMPEPVPDLLGGGPAGDVKTLRYNARLYCGDEINEVDNLSLVPLAVLVREGDVVRLDRRYAPPCVDMNAMPVLREMLKDMRDSLVSRARQLEEYKIIVGDANVAMVNSAQSIALFTILGTLSRYAPVLEHLLEAPALHPWMVYGVLRQIVGELSIFSAELSPLGETVQGRRILPAYAHDDLVSCFEAAKAIITRLVEALVVGPDYMLRLAAEGPILHAAIPPGAFGAGFAYWLLIRSATPAPRMTDLVRLQVKCGSREDLAALVAKALPGIRIRAAATPPAGLPRRGDTTYYAVDTEDSLWKNVAAQGDFAIFFPDAPQDLVAHLAAIRI